MTEPTREQVLEWVRAAGLHEWYADQDRYHFVLASKLCALAYAAGAREENDTCADMAEQMALYTGVDVATALRARRPA